MPDRVNQHFVLQFYFRNFTGGSKHIGALLKTTGRIVPAAPIKGQCAKNNFYGSKELESLFSNAESKYSSAIRRTLEVSWDHRAPDLTPEEYHVLLEATVFQRARTAIQAHKAAPATQGLGLQFLKMKVEADPDIDDEFRRKILDHIEQGNIKVTEPPHVAVLRHIDVSLGCGVGLADLRGCILRNHTDYPFIFGDAPVVYYNSYCWKVKNRGVLGVQCPGLQVFYPLDCRTMLLLFDASVYQHPLDESLIHDISERADVSQINALQLHHSLNAVYFGQTEHQGYVQDLWQAHASRLVVPTTECRINPDLWVDGKPPEGELIQMMESQVDHDLDLSFLQCNRISQADYVFKPRSKELHDLCGRTIAGDNPQMEYANEC